MSKKSPLLLTIDMGNLMRRQLYGNPPLSYKGKYTQCIKGTLSKIEELKDRYSPTHIALCYDDKHPTFRHKLYADYKGTRDRSSDGKPDHCTEEVFNWQSRKCFELLSAMGLAALKGKGVEADDWLGSSAYAFLAKYPEGKVLVHSGDKDMSQLVSSKITHIYPLPFDPKNKGPQHLLLDKRGVKKKFGVKPRQMCDYLAMVGDSVDNIPGVVGIGAKTAQTLLEKYGSLSGIRENRKQLTKAQQTKFQQCSQLKLWRQLVEIKCDIPLNAKELKIGQSSDPKLTKTMLKELGFKEVLAKMNSSRLF